MCVLDFQPSDICPEEIEKAIKVVDATDDNDRLTKVRKKGLLAMDFL